MREDDRHRREGADEDGVAGEVDLASVADGIREDVLRRRQGCGHDDGEERLPAQPEGEPDTERDRRHEQDLEPDDAPHVAGRSPGRRAGAAAQRDAEGHEHRGHRHRAEQVDGRGDDPGQLDVEEGDEQARDGTHA